jgi:hypothetical protein
MVFVNTTIYPNDRRRGQVERQQGRQPHERRQKRNKTRHVQRNNEVSSQIIVAVEKHLILHIFLCVRELARFCVRACGRPNAWACSCACVYVALLFQHATRMSHIVTSFVAHHARPNFSTLSHKRCDFRKKKKK